MPSSDCQPERRRSTGFAWELQPYWSGLRSEICTRCASGDANGACRLDPQLDCALQTSLPFLVHTIRRIRKEEVQGSLRELRSMSCERCAYSSARGYCMLAEVDCALVHYFPRVVKVIKNISLSIQTGDQQ